MEIARARPLADRLTRERGGQDQGADGRGARRRGDRAARRHPGRRLLRLPVRRSASTAAPPRATTSSTLEGVRVVVDPFSAPYLQGADDRLPRRPPGVRVQDRQPERRLVLRLRPLVPGRRGRGAARGTHAGGCGSGCSSLSCASLRFVGTLLRGKRAWANSRLRPGRRRRPVATIRTRAGFASPSSAPGRRLLRGGALLDATCRRGRHVRAAADAVGPRPARRRAGPSEHQGGLARVREDRRAARASGSSATSRWAATCRTTSCASSTTRSSTRSARRPTGGSASPARTCPARWSATEFVAWYNGHPDFQELEFDLDVERAVVIGNGNVALDVARMLALTPEELAPTDTTDAAIEAIARLGRSARSSCSAAAARPRPRSRPRSCRSSASSRAPTSSSIRPSSSSIRRARRRSSDDTTRAARTSRCCASTRSGTPTGKPQRVAAALPALAGRDRTARSGSRRSRSCATSSSSERRHAARRRRPGSARRSSAASSFAASATAASALPGRAVRRAARHDPKRRRPRPRRRRRAACRGGYCAGWIKRGPSGVIGTNKKDANETVEAPAGGCSRGPRQRIATRSTADGDRGAARRARRAGRHVRGLGRRSTSSSARPASSSGARA